MSLQALQHGSPGLFRTFFQLLAPLFLKELNMFEQCGHDFSPFRTCRIVRLPQAQTLMLQDKELRILINQSRAQVRYLGLTQK